MDSELAFLRVISCRSAHRGGSELYGYSISFLHSISFFSKIYSEPLRMVLLRLIPFLLVAGCLPVTGGRAMREVC